MEVDVDVSTPPKNDPCEKMRKNYTYWTRQGQRFMRNFSMHSFFHIGYISVKTEMETVKSQTIST